MPPDHVVSVKFSDAELEVLEGLIPHLKEKGQISGGTKSEVLRLAIRFLCNQALSEIETKRFY